MKRMKRSVLALTIASAVFLAPASDVYAHGHGSGHHGGSTHYYYCGGHSAHTHSGGVCPYADDVYYHCGGHAAHLHEDGVCPYAYYVSKSTVKKVQKKLNRCGYSCGTADGVMGTKTKKALKKYQKDNGLTVDGVIGKATLESLGLA